jgi:hypothetical protein
MADQQESSSGWQRAKDRFKKPAAVVGIVRVIAGTTATGPVPQQAQLDPVTSQQAIVHQLDQRELEQTTHQYADLEELRLEREAEQRGKAPQREAADKPQPQRDRDKSSARKREPGR